jgi:hypothetical protein
MPIDNADKIKADNNVRLGVISSIIANQTDVDITNPANAEKANSAILTALRNGDLTRADMELMISTQVNGIESTLTSEDKLRRDELYLTMFKAMINTNDLTPKQKNLIESDVNSSFWQSQLLEEVKNEVNKFRVKIN